MSPDQRNSKKEYVSRFVCSKQFLGSANEDSSVPSILNHLLTKPEIPPEDFLKADIYTSPKFRLDESKSLQKLSVKCYSNCKEKDGNPLYRWQIDKASKKDILRNWRLSSRLQKASPRKSVVRKGKEALNDDALENFQDCIAKESFKIDWDLADR